MDNLSQNNKKIQNLSNEILWHEDNPCIKKNHFLMRYPFVHPRRHDYAYTIARENTRKAIHRYLENRKIKLAKLLVAPSGTNADQDILGGFAKEVYGIDVAQKAIDRCPDFINKKLGDVLKSGYESDYFDATASFLFFHHLHKVGSGPYLKELHRITKKEGLLFILEPGNLFPISWVTSLGRKIFGNISGLVPDEAPIYPPRFTDALITSGFKVEMLQSVSFSHVRIPLPLQKLINSCSKPFQKMTYFNQTGWLLLWICKKV